MDMSKLSKIADGVASVSKRFDSFLERRKDKRGDADDRTKKMGEIAKANPDWSLKKIEAHLNLKPSNNASAFKKGTPAREAEEKDYAERMKSYTERNKKSDSARSDASKEWEDAKKSWSDKGSVNGFSVGDRIRVKSDTGLGKSEGAGSEAKITHVSTSGLVKVDKRNWVFATHHIEKA